MTKMQAMGRGLVISIVVIAAVAATAVALDRWWPTSYAGLICGVVGVVVFLVGLVAAFYRNTSAS